MVRVFCVEFLAFHENAPFIWCVHNRTEETVSASPALRWQNIGEASLLLMTQNSRE